MDDDIVGIVPDLVIAGAPKCGTTALHSYLASHPGIAMSLRKEPYYWSPDIRIAAPVTRAADYAALWSGAPPGTLRGEATPAYLRSAVAIPTILAAGPGTRFIVMLRNPASMAASYHAQLLVSLQEDVADFATAWRLQPERAAGRRVPRSCLHPPNLQYAKVCALGDQLARAVELVPARQLHIVLQDDLRADPRGVYLGVLGFLGLEDDGRTAFDPVNRNQRRRAPGLVRLTRRLTGGRCNPLRVVSGPVARLSDRLSLVESRRKPIDPAFDAELHDYFLPQVETIERLLGRDLSHWKSPRVT